MTTGTLVVRAGMGIIGAVLLLGGAAVAFGLGSWPGAFLVAGWMILSGGILLIVALIEVSRYRSQSAETAKQAPGPGGGETGALEPRFRRTEEVFEDPTAKITMRVFIDPATGERRYVAER